MSGAGQRLFEEYDESEPPRRCDWCRGPLDEGDRFVHEVEVVSLAEGDVSLMTHEALKYVAGAVASCRECRLSMIDNWQEVADEADEESKFRLRPVIHKVLLGFALFMGVCFSFQSAVNAIIGGGFALAYLAIWIIANNADSPISSSPADDRSTE